MPYIDADGRSEDQDELKSLYRECADPRTGAVDHILKIHALHPAGLRAHLALYTAVMRGTRSLRKVDRELVALVVSDHNGCHY